MYQLEWIVIGSRQQRLRNLFASHIKVWRQCMATVAALHHNILSFLLFLSCCSTMHSIYFQGHLLVHDGFASSSHYVFIVTSRKEEETQEEWEKGLCSLYVKFLEDDIQYSACICLATNQAYVYRCLRNIVSFCPVICPAKTWGPFVVEEG